MDASCGEDSCVAISSNDATNTWLQDYLEPRPAITQNVGDLLC
ncbi:hypothetical protein P879_09126 [Paragonimus westermani]|uniref:Uncharacterized protein n=1 Tax=Paragonimus westermani TaxID=34504 RepID=A0A8T0DLH6_9TREM|nr:hypothetical protein P879_09126 [Paragonimus westermani]